MTPVYAVALLVGAVALIAWIISTAIASSVEGWGWLDPEGRLGRRGRMAVAALFGFGMAGLSATFGGWPAWAAAGAAAAGAAASAWYAARFGPRSGS